MEPLTPQQEVSLLSTGEDENNKSEKISPELDDSTFEMKTTLHQDPSPSPELIEAPSENILDVSNHISAVDNADHTNTSGDSPVEDLQFKSTIDTNLETPKSITSSDSEIADHNLASSLLQTIPETEINSTNGEHADLSNIKDHINELQGDSAVHMLKKKLIFH